MVALDAVSVGLVVNALEVFLVGGPHFFSPVQMAQVRGQYSPSPLFQRLFALQVYPYQLLSFIV